MRWQYVTAAQKGNYILGPLKAYFDVVKVNKGFNGESTIREFLVVLVTPKLSSAIMKELEKDLGKLALKYGLTVK